MQATGSDRRRRPAAWLRAIVLIAILLLILGWMIWPIAGVMIAGSIAAANNCQLDEGSIHPCIVDGVDIGERLYGMGVMGWFMLVTIPTGLIALAIYGVVLVIVWFVLRRRRQRASPPSVQTVQEGET